MTSSPMRPSTGLFDLAAPSPSAVTIHVTDSYQLAEGDTLSLNGGVGFKLELKNGVSVSLDIAGTVDIKGHHTHTGGVISTASDNGDATVTIAETGSVSVVSTEPAAQAFGILLTTNNAAVANAGTIHVVADGAAGVMIRAQGHVDFSNTGTIEVEAGATSFGYGFYGDGSSGTISNAGRIAVSGGTVLGMAFLGGDATNTGEISVTSDNVHGFAFGVGLDVNTAPTGPTHGHGEPLPAGYSFTNDGAIRVVSAGQAVGEDLVSMAGMTNHGLISAVSEVDDSIGLHFSTAVPGGAVENFGTIRGFYSVATEDGVEGGLGFATDDMILNYGKLDGGVMLGGGDDIFSNQGRTLGDVDLGEGDDSFDSSAGRMTGAAFGGLGDDTMIGSGKADTLHGDDMDGSPGAGGADLLRGMGGSDSLSGGDGADTLIGGAGGDTLAGGDGDDVFKFNRVSDSAGVGIDQISDLTDTDVIDLRSIDADTGTGGDQGFHLVGAFTGAAEELTVSYDAGANLTTISGDVDGDGSADLVITASGDHQAFTNFVL